LLEVQITIVLVVVAIVGLAGAMATSTRSQGGSRERQVVSHALASQLETITQTPFDQIATRYGDAQFEIPGVLPTASTRPAGRVQVVVRDPDFLSSFRLKLIGPSHITYNEELLNKALQGLGRIVDVNLDVTARRKLLGYAQRGGRTRSSG
jgi:hypothetical protein